MSIRARTTSMILYLAAKGREFQTLPDFLIVSDSQLWVPDQARWLSWDRAQPGPALSLVFYQQFKKSFNKSLSDDCHDIHMYLIISSDSNFCQKKGNTSHSRPFKAIERHPQISLVAPCLPGKSAREFSWKKEEGGIGKMK